MAEPNGISLRVTALAVVQPPHQFKTFKFEMPEAVEGRKRVKELGDEVKIHDKNIKVNFRQKAASDNRGSTYIHRVMR